MALTGSPTPEAQPSSGPPATASPADTAVIARSASTNQSAYSIAVPRAGQAMVRVGTVGHSVALEPALSSKLYADLEQAGDLDKLPVEHCMKSASFGTTTVITFAGKTSPDLQCAADAVGRSLNADAEAIANAALTNVPLTRRHTLPVYRANPPQT